MERKASAQWNGGLKDGHGTITSESGALSATAYSFHTRFEDGPGTNPEELIAAAHAGCFSMAFANELSKAGMNPVSVETTAVAAFEKTDAGFTITKIHLSSVAQVPGAAQEAFDAAAQAAKVGCPISRVLRAEITLDAKLEG